MLLTTGQPAAGGGFVARDADGRVTFVRHALPGERVRAVMTEEHATWARADAIEILEPSPDRVVPPCPFAGPSRCGGCDYQHASIDAQRRLKSDRVSEQLAGLTARARVAVEPPPSAGSGLGTRTRVRYGVTDDGLLGMRKHASHELVAVGHCPLGVARLTDAEQLEDAWPARHDVEVISLSVGGAPTVLIEPRTTGVRRSPHAMILERSGLAPNQLAEVRGHSLSVSAGSFFQVHDQAPALLVSEVLDGLDLAGGEHVADLYCGVGLFTVVIAAAVGPRGSVVGVDGSDIAIGDARGNLAAFPWAKTRHAGIDARVVAETVTGRSHAVVDPPRAGVDRVALDALARCDSLRRLVYVSCEPSTLARDLGVLHSNGWVTTTLRCFDLFEMTEHVECVAVLER